MSGTPSVLVAGHVTHDRYGEALVPGGCAYYAARVYRGLGAPVSWATSVGADFACEGAFAGLEAQVRREGKTTLFTNRYPPGGIRVQRIEAQAPAVLPDLPPGWGACDVLHLAPVMGEIDLALWKDATSARLVAIGVQGWIKEAGPEHSVRQRAWDVDGAALKGVGVACVGEEDLRDQGDLLDRLVRAIPVVAFTHGRSGCDVIVRGKTTRVGVVSAVEIDPTGAGDSFAAGFVYALARGDSPPDAARLGAAVASIVVEGRGGETLDRISEAYERAPRVE